MAWVRWGQTAKHVTATTERSNGTGSYTDVTGASFSLPVAANSVTFIGLTCSCKSSDSLTVCYVRVNGGSGFVRGTGYDPTIPAASDAMFIHDGRASGTSYVQYGVAGSIHSAVSGTGSQTFKVVFAGYKSGGGGTGYIKDVYLTAYNVPYNT